MVFLDPYIDESGTQASAPILSLAGYVATTEQWTSFSVVWEEIIRDLQGWQSESQYFFHMTEFAGNFGPYRPLKENPAKKREFSERIINAIRDHRQFGFCVAMRVQDYEAVTSSEWRELFGSAYTLLAEMCLGFVGTWVDGYIAKNDAVEPLMYVLEQGAPHQREADEFLALVGSRREEKAQYHYRNHIFLDKRDTPPLQAADVLACEAYRELTRQITGRSSAGDYYLLDLVDESDKVVILNPGRIEHLLVETLAHRFPEHLIKFMKGRTSA